MTATTTRLFPILALTGVLLAPPASAQQYPELVYEFSVIPGEGGQPDFGFPFHAAASPDGRHLYVDTFPPGAALLTFERVGQSLVLLDSIDLLEAGITSSVSDLEITEDGAYVLLGEFSSAKVHVYARDAATGLLELVQTIELSEGAGTVVDGIATGLGAVVWGRPAFPETGGWFSYLEREDLSSTSATRSVSPRDAFMGNPPEKLPTAIDTATAAPKRDGDDIWDAAGILTEDEVIVFYDIRDQGKCRLSLDALREEIDKFDAAANVKALRNIAVLYNGNFDIGLTLDNGTRLTIEIDPNDCSVVNTFALAAPPLPDDVVVPEARVVTDVPSGVVDVGPNREIRSYDADLASVDEFSDDPNLRGSRFIYGPDDPDDAIDIAIFYLDRESETEPLPPGRPADLTSAGFVQRNRSTFVARTDGERAADVRDAFLYATVLNPPMIHALRLTDDFASAGGGCIPGPNTLCLSGFSVETEWQDFQGNTGVGTAVPGSSDSGLFWFFNPANWEMLIKVLDACALNERFWVIYAATTNVGFDVTVSHEELGSKTYSNALGTLAPALLDTDAFACTPAQVQASRARLEHDPRAVARELGVFLDEAAALGAVPVPAPQPQGSCTNDDDTLCLTPDRFRVEVAWRDFQGNTGVGHVVPLRSTDSGLFWFFDAANWELLIKVLDACVLNDRFWTLAAATTNVEYTLTITDTVTGEQVVISNPLGNPSQAVVDVDAFAGCE